ncbi:hypothetical protein B7Q40_004639 [Salmonella enterica subsp. enterica serovar Java]|uniref:Uncharacterized protein n=2 Tax=Salmonella enterica TaxID=28901 RepID=A0A3R0UED0_SALER|nr:hypothetical protein [Salmonella enterica subsp. enterica serovar Java]EAO1481043.1 hypothetical protein [Salmonella enterica]ECS8432553.1 hypothetical protein [Salmonella enterica]EDR2522694.1 hypothetical protein [Salmonella enterica subsp. enterica serovar Java]EDU0623195.1 hypothetical protein [Salmonella enterica subsp. enterica serovar Java]
MLLSDYIDRMYGSSRGNRARFLKDNPDILPQELSRWLKAGLKIRPETAEIYKPVSRRVRVPDVSAAEAGVFLSDSLRGRLTTLAAGQGVRPDEMLSALVEREELRRQLAPVPAGEDAVPEQLIAGVVSRHFASLSEHSETEAWHLVLSALVSELVEADLLSFHTGNVTESRRLNIPRTAYYWYGGFVAKRVAMMLGCYHVYLWNDMMHPESDVVFIGDARNVVACWFICQQMCRLLKAVRLNWRKQQGAWGSRAELDEESHQYAKRLAYSVLDNGIFIGGDEQRSHRLYRYAEKHYARAMR